MLRLVLKNRPPVGHRVGHRVGHGLGHRVGHGLGHVLSTPAFVCTSESYELFKKWSFLQYSNTNKEHAYMYRSAPLHLNNITVSLQWYSNIITFETEVKAKQSKWKLAQWGELLKTDLSWLNITHVWPSVLQKTKRPVATPFCSCVQFSPRVKFQMLHVQFSRKITRPFVQQRNYGAPTKFCSLHLLQTAAKK